jgi:hypothetical protein
MLIAEIPSIHMEKAIIFKHLRVLKGALRKRKGPMPRGNKTPSIVNTINTFAPHTMTQHLKRIQMTKYNK